MNTHYVLTKTAKRFYLTFIFKVLTEGQPLNISDENQSKKQLKQKQKKGKLAPKKGK